MLDDLKANNRAWAERKTADDPGFFKRLVDQQAPAYFWIGCSDSRAPPQDANYLSVLQFAVDVLRVKHILVVGHYGCGGIAAAVDGNRRGLVDHWLHPIREVYEAHRDELGRIDDQEARLNRLCELNVMRQVRNVASDLF